MTRAQTIWFAILMLAAVNHPAQAQFACANCATWWDQLLTKYEIILQRVAQTRQLQTEIQNFQLAVKNGALLDVLASTTVGSQALRVQKLAWQTQYAVKDVQDITEGFEKSYMGFKGFTNKPNNTFGDMYGKWSDRQRRSAIRSYKAAGYTKKEIDDEKAYRDKLREQLATAEGTGKILQANGDLSAHMVEQNAELIALLQAQISQITDSGVVDTEKQNYSAANRAKLQALGIEGMDDDHAKHKPSCGFRCE